MKKIKILILGAKGMLGQELSRIFRLDKNYEVSAWDKEDLDITNNVALVEKISKLCPKIIINAAAYNAVDRAEEDEEYEKAKKINAFAVGYLVCAAINIDAFLIHYSTDYVFDGKKNFYAEYDQPNPISNYGRSKYLGEKEILDSKNSYACALNEKPKKFNFYLIRTSKIFGHPGSSNEAKSSFFETILALGKKQAEVRVIDSEKSCFTYAPDLALATKKLLESKKSSGIYHITNSDPCTWYEATKVLYNLVGIKTKVIAVSPEEFPRPAPRPNFSVLLNTKITPLRSYKDALKTCLPRWDTH